jgi:hypothetical protein
VCTTIDHNKLWNFSWIDHLDGPNFNNVYYSVKIDGTKDKLLDAIHQLILTLSEWPHHQGSLPQSDPPHPTQHTLLVYDVHPTVLPHNVMCNSILHRMACFLLQAQLAANLCPHLLKDMRPHGNGSRSWIKAWMPRANDKWRIIDF